MAKKRVKKPVKRRVSRVKSVQVIKKIGSTDREFLELCIANTKRHTVFNSRPEPGMVDQLARLEAELAAYKGE
jgi:hypothetical protein